MKFAKYDSPVGELTLASDGEALTALLFPSYKPEKFTDPKAMASVGADKVIDSVRRQLDEYFAGKRTTFDVKLNAYGTPFRKRVWDALVKVPYGKTVSYSAIADMIQSPKAVRAVGSANGANPISIIVPCHRIIGANGTLTGYGGGLDRKQFLLALEQGQKAFAA